MQKVYKWLIFKKHTFWSNSKMSKDRRNWTLNQALRVLGEVHLKDRSRICRGDCFEVERILEEASFEDIGTSNPLAADDAWHRQHLSAEEARKKQSGLPTGMHYVDGSIDGRESELNQYVEDEADEYSS